jgi:hypothetical protein
LINSLKSAKRFKFFDFETADARSFIKNDSSLLG